MASQRQKLTFPNNEGEDLAGLLELPAGEVLGYALFAHCFTCGKDLKSASRIARGLVSQGIATLRFDFTGLGNSDGDFANTNFSSNVEDLVAAANYLETEYQAPALLIGHSLGGAAVLAAAHAIPSAKAVVTIAAPAEPGHVAHLFDDARGIIKEEGVAEVNLAGRPFRIKQQFLDDIEGRSLQQKVGQLRRPLLIFHAPMDQTVSIDDAATLYGYARHPKSFISLDDADHLVTSARDADYIADTLVAWVKRYLEADEEAEQAVKPAKGHVLVAERNHRFTRSVFTDTHQWLADEPKSSGGDDRGPDPYDHLLASLGTCTSMTIRMYANHKKWPLDDVYVTLKHSREHGADCDASCSDEDSEALVDVIDREVRLEGDQLSDEQRERLLEIANRCPVHRTLENEIRVDTRLADK